ncbi:uncharacterized protein [Cherax quadricarinatus]|uniref:uncharacterized protein n=1 Tax=Cherax quadricarinatus TaxID=27406 RepID=UPI00387EC1EB
MRPAVCAVVVLTGLVTGLKTKREISLGPEDLLGARASEERQISALHVPSILSQPPSANQMDTHSGYPLRLLETGKSYRAKGNGNASSDRDDSSTIGNNLSDNTEDDLPQVIDNLVVEFTNAASSLYQKLTSGLIDFIASWEGHEDLPDEEMILPEEEEEEEEEEEKKEEEEEEDENHEKNRRREELRTREKKENKNYVKRESKKELRTHEEEEAKSHNKSKRKSRSSDYGATKYGETGLDKSTHVYSVLAVIVFSAFLGYMVYHYLSSSAKEKKRSSWGLHGWSWSHEDLLQNLLKEVTVAVVRWTMLEDPPGAEDL